MGIPSYFKNTINDYPDIISPSENFKNKNLNNNNNLFLDLNCAIHPCCAGKTDENEMYQAILEKIKECIKVTNVKNLVYKINEIELLIKKNSNSSINILSDFIIEQATVISN